MANENRLVSESERTDLIRCLKKLHDAQFTLGIYEHSVVGRAALFLEDTADAVKVVRCKDCKKSQKWKNAFGAEGLKCYLLCADIDPDDFCSYGERKDNEGKVD